MSVSKSTGGRQRMPARRGGGNPTPARLTITQSKTGRWSWTLELGGHVVESSGIIERDCEQRAHAEARARGWMVTRV